MPLQMVNFMLWRSHHNNKTHQYTQSSSFLNTRQERLSCQAAFKYLLGGHMRKVLYQLFDYQVLSTYKEII